MAESLKDQYGEDVPHKIASMLKQASPAFNCEAFIAACLLGYQELELTARAHHIAEQMRDFLPDDFSQSSAILLRSLGSPLANTDEFGMGPFIYLPHVFYAAKYGLDHFDEAMILQYALTQRFTAEFSIRAFIQHYPEKTMLVLHQWCKDDSPHVRRLVSEGTRPRLPWASRLPAFQQDPTAVFELLEKLKDDQCLYVRRSVANNLNDIYKDNPEAVNRCLQQWIKNADNNRKWLIKHALRSAVKAGDKQALKILGYSAPNNIVVTSKSVLPASPQIGETVEIRFSLSNQQAHTQPLMVDAKIYFIKANGLASAKVFKLKTLELSPYQSVVINKKVTLKQLTTRKHYPGIHNVSLVLNGIEQPLGHFELYQSAPDD